MVSNWWAAGFLALYVILTYFAPRILGNPSLVWKHPQAVVRLWLVSLALSIVALTLGLGLLIARALSHHVNHLHGHDWLGPVIDSILGWVAIAAIGVIAFRLGVAGSDLRAEKRVDDEELSLIVASAKPARIGQNNIFVVDSPRTFIGVIARLRRILMTSKVQTLLNENQLNAALAHEQAHIDGHHFALRTIGELAERTASGIRASKRMSQAMRITTELIADDVAAKKFGSENVADALERGYENDPVLQERIIRLRSRL